MVRSSLSSAVLSLNLDILKPKRTFSGKKFRSLIRKATPLVYNIGEQDDLAFDPQSVIRATLHRPLHKSLSTRGSARAYLHGIIKQKTPVKTPSHYLLRSNSNKSLATSSEHSAQNGNGESSSSLLTNNGQIDLEPLKREKFRAQGFLITDDGALVVYTDGSAKGDGVAGGRPTRAGCGVWWGESGKAHDW